MNALPFRPLRCVPPESIGAVMQNQQAHVENAVRVRADLRNASADLRERAIDKAIQRLREGASGAAAVESGWNYLKDHA